MTHTTLGFDFFNPLLVSHWLVMLAQLARLERYFYVVHVALLLPDGEELTIKANHLGITEKQSHDRWMCYHPLITSDPAGLARLLHRATSRKYLLNCALVCSSLTLGPHCITPAKLYERSIRYTSSAILSACNSKRRS